MGIHPLFFLLFIVVTHPRTPPRDPFLSTPTPLGTPGSRRRRTDREPSLHSLPPAPLGTGSTQAPQSTYIQTLTRQQIIAAELSVSRRLVADCSAGLKNEGHCPQGIFIVPSPNDSNRTLHLYRTNIKYGMAFYSSIKVDTLRFRGNSRSIYWRNL